MIFDDWCNNERRLCKDIKQVNRMINRAIKEENNGEIRVLTKILALMYSAYIEVSFNKMINTPYGLPKEYILEIQRQSNIEERWKKCLELSFMLIHSKGKNSILGNQKLKMKRIMDEYIICPSKIRNKIAHGQWEIAFNNKATSPNRETTEYLDKIDPVVIMKNYNIYKIFAKCIEDLIESPNKAHFRYYYQNISKLDDYIRKSQYWNIDSKRESIMKKYNRYKNHKV